MSAPANDNDQVDPLVISAGLAVRLGAKPIPFDKDGMPITLKPPRPTFIVYADGLTGQNRWMYWEMVPGAEQGVR